MADTMVLFSQPKVRAKRKLAPHEQVLIDYTSQFMHLTDAEINTIFDLITIKEYKKGKFLLREGQIGNVCYFVLQGCVRQYYLVDGIEKTTNFFTEGQPINSTLVFENKPSRSYLVCNEDCIVVEGRADDEQAFLTQMPRMEALGRIGVEAELQKTHEVHAEYVIASPIERYKNLLQTRPELLDRVPQYQLASYLGITPESLSRIRKRIMKKEGAVFTS
jgi:CRP-like cAMP-binding protein